MSWHKNPFNELYVSENIPSEDFVKLFSPYLVKSASELYSSGNVIVRGIQGTGKTMLLALLEPSIRIAYEATDTVKYPIPKDHQKFLSATINITHSNAYGFCNFVVGKSQNKYQNIHLNFADYVNYVIVSNLLGNIILFLDETSVEFHKKSGLDLTEAKLTKFANLLSLDDCWHGNLNGLDTLENIKEKLDYRISQYKKFLNNPKLGIQEEIDKTLTEIGEPISRCVKALRESKVISNDTNVFVVIDQYEELHHIESKHHDSDRVFSQIINRAIARRDRLVSYRISSRPYAWYKELSIYGKGTAQLESERDYRLLDIDDILRRSEHTKSWIFPKFVNEVFKKRIEFSGYRLPENSKDLLQYVFSNSPSPQDKARIYAGSEPERIVQSDENWPKEWIAFLHNMSKNNPLSAKYAEAWARQKDKGDIVFNIPDIDNLPWDNKKKPWWKKERTEQALMQIASKRNQALIWYGKNDLIGLSGGNILVFISTCQKIWNVWLRSEIDSNLEENELPHKVEFNYQIIGIRESSQYWYHKIEELPGGSQRQRFVKYLGDFFHKKLQEDKSMSYPGNNGFSITEEDLSKLYNVKEFLMTAADYSDLVVVKHTTKLADKKPRIKIYLKPILCPYFKIPYIRTKEPLYLKLESLLVWLGESGVIKNNKVYISSSKQDDQFEMF